MKFITDEQTLSDLNVFGTGTNGSVFELFNKTLTSGGAALLDAYFRFPIADLDVINQRSATIKQFADKRVDFPFQTGLFDSVERYLANRDERTRLVIKNLSISEKIDHLISEDSSYKVIYSGVISLITLLQNLKQFTVIDHPILARIVEESDFAPVFLENTEKKLTYPKIAKYDNIFRFQSVSLIEELLQYLYQMDVFITVAKVAISHQFNFAKAVLSGDDLLAINGAYHPNVKGAVTNDLSVSITNNIVFLTGANMAGKSTLMKTIGIIVLLAHMGFPVPAQQMEFVPLDGLYTTINLSDSLGAGVSHFYAEVLRIKKVAKELNQAKKLFVIFDELFRGTNVKDAHDATVALTTAFARKSDSIFIISTHIIEVGEVLKHECANIKYVYLPTEMDNDKPVYTYKLRSGITADRHGMIIINNERILEILEKKNKPLTASI